MKTNACRLLDALQIRYETREYPVDPDDLSGETVAMKIGLPPEQVFKTLLCRVDQQDIVFAVLSVADELDFKKLAAAAGGRRAEMVPIKEVQPLTGYIRGGVTVFASKKPYQVFVDESIELFDADLRFCRHARNANHFEPGKLLKRSGGHGGRPGAPAAPAAEGGSL